MSGRSVLRRALQKVLPATGGLSQRCFGVCGDGRQMKSSAVAAAWLTFSGGLSKTTQAFGTRDAETAHCRRSEGRRHSTGSPRKQETKPCGIPRDARIRRSIMQALRNPSVIKRQRDFDKSGHARGGLGVADIRLDRTHQNGLNAIGRSKGSPNRFDFHRIAYGRSGAMSFHVLDAGGGHAASASAARMRLV